MLGSLEDPARAAAPPPPQVGVSKAEYFAILDEAGRTRGMRFSLVFIEACRGIFAPGEEQKLPRNVKLLYTSGDRSLQYSTLDYGSLLVQVGPEQTLSAVLDDWLEPRYLALYRERADKWWQWLWFLPLALLAIWTAWRFLRPKPAGRATKIKNSPIKTSFLDI